MILLRLSNNVVKNGKKGNMGDLREIIDFWTQVRENKSIALMRGKSPYSGYILGKKKYILVLYLSRVISHWWNTQLSNQL